VGILSRVCEKEASRCVDGFLTGDDDGFDGWGEGLCEGDESS